MNRINNIIKHIEPAPSSLRSTIIKKVPKDDKVIQECSVVLARGFTEREPLVSGLALQFDDFYKWSFGLLKRVVAEDDICFYSINELHEKITAVMLCERLNREEPLKYPYPNPRAFEKVVQLLEKLDSFADVTVLESKTLHIFMVASDGSAKGCAAQLLDHTLAEAKRNGYKYVLVEATAPQTQRIFFSERFSFVPVGEISFATYNIPGNGKAVLGVKEL